MIDKNVIQVSYIDLRMVDVNANTTYEHSLIVHEQVTSCTKPNATKPNMEFDL